MSIILGVDPGSRKTGFGVIQQQGRKQIYIASGVIRLPTDAPLSERLNILFESLVTVISQYQPDEMAVEDIFISKNASSALKLGHARGVILVAGGQNNIPIAEYEARKVKQAVTGSGAAAKEAVQHMVKTMLKLPGTPQEDAADALAVALCHAQYRLNPLAQSNSAKFRRGRLNIG